MKKQNKVLAFVQGNGPVMVLAALFLFSCIAFGTNFFSYTNLSNLIRQVSIMGLAAIGINFVIISGGRDLSVGSVCAVAAMVMAYLSPYGFFPAVLGALAAGVLLGLINGLVITRLGVQPFIATLGMQLGARGIALLMNGELSIPVDESMTSITFIGRGYIAGIPVPALLFVGCVMLAYFVARRTRFGRAVYAIGGNEESAAMMGLRINRTKVIVYMISGLTTALAAVVLTSRLGAGLPVAGEGWDMTIMATVIIGGTLIRGGVGDMRGVLVGVLICGIITNMINMFGNISTYWQNIINGLLLLAAVIMQTRSANKAALLTTQESE
nr:ABC transporter permease [Maliibacterium massiliense]